MSRLFSSVPLTQFSGLESLITDNPIYRDKNARLALFTVGAGYALLKTLSLAQDLLRPLFIFEKDLGARYGRGSWAVITGASDGIGKGFVFELARRGFNIILIGRNKEKLDNVVLELKIAYPQAQTQVIVADSNNANEEGFAEKILEQVGTLDVSILVNNAGMAVRSYYQDTPFNSIRESVLTNCLAHALVTKVFLPKLSARAQRSAIINTVSLAASSPRPCVTLYSSTKAFHDFLSRALVYEYPNIDILSSKPGLVSTKMTGYIKPSLISTSVEEHVKVTLKYLGSVHETHGHWRHRLEACFIRNLPDFLQMKYFKRKYNM